MHVQDLNVRQKIFWSRFDPCVQLGAMKTAQDEMKVLEETFGIERPLEGITMKQRERNFLYSQRALSVWCRGLITRNFGAWKERVQNSRSKRAPPSRGSNRPHSVGSKLG